MRVPTILALVCLALLFPSAALGAAPTREFISLDDPAFDADETAFVSDLCGFPIDAELSGHVIVTSFPKESTPGVFALNVYGVRVTYTNPETGKVARLRDVGPDRFFVKGGVAYVAVTGRSETGSGIVGVVIIDLTTGDVVHQAGNDIGVIYDRLCAALS
jgi:hypothetical protein